MNTLRKQNTGQKTVIIKMALYFIFIFFCPKDILAQVKKISKNYRDDFKESYYNRTNLGDTVLIIINQRIPNLLIENRIRRFNNLDYEEIVFIKKYDKPIDPCVELKFIHHPGPPMANEQFLIDKRFVDKSAIQVIFEKDTHVNDWLNHESDFFEKTLILVDEKDWFGKKKKVKGIGVQIYTTGSCNDLIIDH